MHRTPMRAIVSVITAPVAVVALVSAGCTPTPNSTPAPAPTASERPASTPDPISQREGNPVSAQDVQALWNPVASAATQGGYAAWGIVMDARTGEVLLNADASTAHTPASTTKTLTAFAALNTLDTSATLTTRTLLDEDGNIYLDSEGDLLLGAGLSNPNDTSGRAGLQTLANDTAAQLAARGITSTTVSWRDSLFEGATHLAAWDAQDVGNYEGHVGPMAIDAGRTYEGANEFYADAPAYVATVFAQALTNAGVSTQVSAGGQPPAGATPIASVSSATMGEQLRWMLARSDNTLADQYCRFAARAASQPTTYEGGVATIESSLSAAGVSTAGLHLDDCSGLSSSNRISADTLSQLLLTSYRGSGASADLIRLLPWAGLEGTLSRRMTQAPAAGNVQAKTGALAEVTALSGIVTTQGGRDLIVSIGHDGVTSGNAAATREVLDAFEEDLASLH